MSFKGVGGSKRLGIAIGSSIVVHIVAFFLLVSIGGGGSSEKSSEPPPLPPPPEGMLDQPAAIADSVEPPARGSTASSESEDSAKATSRPKASKPKAPEAKPQDAKKPETRKSEAKKPEAKKPEAPKAAENSESDAPAGEWKTYEVRPGDSLTKIAKKCGISIQELAKANGLKPTASLNLGQKIKIKASE